MEKAPYYRYRLNESGSKILDPEGKPEIETVGPFPADGDWPSRYAARGLYLQRPVEPDATDDAKPLYCPVEDCEHFAGTEDEPGLNPFASASDLADHAKEDHDSLVYREIVSGELVLIEDVEPVDLTKLSRAELNAYSTSAGIENADRLPNIGSVIDAINALPSLEEEIVTLRAKVKELTVLLEEATKPK